MKSITLVFILLTTFSCNSQNNQEVDITGNWYNDTKKVKVNYYVEVFIDDEAFNVYNEYSGFAGHKDYIIENNLFYYVSQDTLKEKKRYIKFIDKNTISIGNGDIILKRITEGLKLEDLLRNDKPERDYRKFFNERKAIWEESRNN
jgi:hypothetical protein